MACPSGTDSRVCAVWVSEERDMDVEVTRWHWNGTACMVTEGECIEDMEEAEEAEEAGR